MDTILTVPTDGIFNFTGIDIGTGINLSFDRSGYEGTIWLASTTDIIIDGIINFTGDLGISAENLISLGENSRIQPIYPNGSGSIYIETNTTIQSPGGGSNEGSIISVGNIVGTEVIAGDPNIIGASVPIPLAIVMFASALLSLLPIQHRKRITQ